MRTSILLPLILAAACGSPQAPPPAPALPPAPDPHAELPAPSVVVNDAAKLDEAKRFLAAADAELMKVVVAGSEAQWANETDLTDAHAAVAARANAAMNDTYARLIKRARTYEPIAGQLDPVSRRMLEVLIYGGGVQPSPDDPKQAEELARLAEEMTGVYGKGKVCTDTGRPGATKTCKDLGQLSEVLQKSRKPAEILAAWQGWHDEIGRAERPLFEKYIGLANAGARAVGFKDVAELWQSGYDMPPDAFAADTDRLWEQVKPLYTQLHCYTRRKLNRLYGDKVAPRTGPIPAQLLGNMWAQTWDYLYPELEPYKGVAKTDVTPALQRLDPKQMVQIGEAFYTSLGMDPLPPTFWERSMLAKPPGKEAVCHASAWDVQYNNDLRIKMCVQKTHEDLVVIHHELGHDYYFHAYYKQPFLFQAGANDGFHEAIGDTVALSMTPKYLQQKGLLAKVDISEKATINHQMRIALGKIAFLPFGLMVDRWRWDAFSGATAPGQLNARWWELAQKYQGIAPPGPRTETDFDPGSKYHVAANVPYMRYFLADILQFQFQRALCKMAGFTGPLHECSIYANKDAGAAYQKMLALGASQPWQDTLYALTGEREMNASALLEYFAPLQAWLDQQNTGQTCGW